MGPGRPPEERRSTIVPHEIFLHEVNTTFVWHGTALLGLCVWQSLFGGYVLWAEIELRSRTGSCCAKYCSRGLEATDGCGLAPCIFQGSCGRSARLQRDLHHIPHTAMDVTSPGFTPTPTNTMSDTTEIANMSGEEEGHWGPPLVLEIPELVALIFAHLSSPRDLVNMACTSKRYSETALQLLWESPDVPGDPLKHMVVLFPDPVEAMLLPHPVRLPLSESLRVLTD